MSINAEIISVGSELLLGQIANTNAQWLSNKLAKIGINVFYHHTVGDNFVRLENVMKLAQDRSDLVIVTGGLGPTDDDLTRDVAKKILQQELVIDEKILQKVKQYFLKNNIKMSENNKKQALVFKGATVFSNTEGMAPGMFVDHHDVGWIFLPGVPREMKAIMEQEAIPFIVKHYHLQEMIFSKVLKFIGIGESILEDKLLDILRNQTNPTIAPLAGDGEVTLRITAKASSKQEAISMFQHLEEEILSRVGEYCYGIDEETLETKVLQYLQQKEMTIASAESLTGGRFIDRLISIPGASSSVVGSIVSYQTRSKEQVLGIDSAIINKYGTISEQCAKEMAEGIQKKMNASIGISFTGNAGPDASEQKPVGIVYIGISNGVKTEVHSYHFHGNREAIRNRAVKKGLELLYKYLKN